MGAPTGVLGLPPRGNPEVIRWFSIEFLVLNVEKYYRPGQRNKRD